MQQDLETIRTNRNCIKQNSKEKFVERKENMKMEEDSHPINNLKLRK